MGGLLHLGMTIAALALRQTRARIACASMIFAAALFFLLIGLLGFAAAAFILLAKITNPLIAALICGASGMVLGAVLLLIARARARPARLLLGDKVAQDLRAEVISMTKSATPGQVLTPLALTALAAFLLTSRR